MVTHDVKLTGLGLAAEAGAVTVLERSDSGFIAAILAELGSESSPGSLGTTVAKTHDPSGTLRLYQPIHRINHVALASVWCDTPGMPRLDPAKIISAGLVVRRVAADRQGRPLDPPLSEAWMRAGAKIKGWVLLRNTREADQDPSPNGRPPVLSAGHPEINRRLAQLSGLGTPLTESVTPMFVAPPDVCKAAGKTIIYGVVPLASTERSEDPDDRSFPIADVKAHLVSYLGPSSTAATPSWAGKTLDATAGDNPDAELDKFLLMLRQLRIELDAFGTDPGSTALFAALNQISLPYADGSSRAAGDALRDAVPVLLGREDGSVTLPAQWPAVSASQAEAIAQAAKASMDARTAVVTGPEGRFDIALATRTNGRFVAVQRLYQLRAFARVKRDDGCPPAVVWSDLGERFLIVPWYEGGGLPPFPIPLPNLSDPNVLKSLKPNVAFVLPPGLQDFLQGAKLDKLMMNQKPDKGLGIGWICSFSLPVITFCAFLVLNIFLSLFDFVFNWMLYIKICLPYPKKTSG
jgi:hypothetical protein